MALKSVTFIVPSDPIYPRDDGKRYLITEMPASAAEKWATRVFLVIARSGVEIPQAIIELGMVGVALFGWQALRNASFAEIEPLMDEMMRCAQAIPNPDNQSLVRTLVENDIEEVRTRLLLRKAILELHVGFTLAELASKLATTGPAKPLT